LYIFDYQKSNENRDDNIGIMGSVDELKIAHFRIKRMTLMFDHFKAEF
jgi:hypothetical protein